MRLSLRFLVPLVAALALLAYIVVPQVDARNLRWFVRDLDSSAQRAAGPLAEQLAELVPQQNGARITALLNSTVQNDRLFAIAYCDAPAGHILYRSTNLPPVIGCTASPTEQRVGDASDVGGGTIAKLPKGSLHVARIPVTTAASGRGRS